MQIQHGTWTNSSERTERNIISKIHLKSTLCSCFLKLISPMGVLLGLQFSCSQMWSYRTPKHLAISRSRMRIKMRCSSSCKCSCGLTVLLKNFRWFCSKFISKNFEELQVFLIPSSCISSSNRPQWCKNLSCTNTYLISKFSKSANIISISEPSCYTCCSMMAMLNGKVCWEPAPSSSLASTLPKQKGRTSVENPWRIWNTQYIIQSHIIPFKMLICYYHVTILPTLASYSLHPWFKTPKHGRAPWPFSPTVFFPMPFPQITRDPIPTSWDGNPAPTFEILNGLFLSSIPAGYTCLSVTTWGI